MAPTCLVVKKKLDGGLTKLLVRNIITTSDFTHLSQVGFLFLSEIHILI